MKHTLVFITLLAGGSFADASTLHCTPQNQNAPVTIIEEDVPNAGLATVTSGQHSAVLRYTKSVEVSQGGCFKHILTKKTFLHPYYQYEIQSNKSWGEDNTRCAGSVSGDSVYRGYLLGEMQEPKSIVCKPAYQQF